MELEQALAIVKGYTMPFLQQLGKRRVKVYVNGFRAFKGTGEALACTLAPSYMNGMNYDVRYESKDCVYINLTEKTKEQIKEMDQVENTIANFVEFYL